MKLNLLLLSILLAKFGYTQSVPNGDFEEWGLYNTWTMDPAEWNVENFQLATNCYQDSLAFEGDFAMKIYPWTFFEPAPGTATVNIPLDAIPPSLNFAVKCFIDDQVPQDSVSVLIQFINTNGGQDWIEVYSKKWFSDISIPEWQEVQLELDQIEPVMDLCRINVIAGYGEFFGEGSPDTWISVDAMGFDQVNTINTASQQELDIYFDQSNSTMKFNGDASFYIGNDLSIYDSSGKLCFSETVRSSILNINLPAGIYVVLLDKEEAQLKTKILIQN